MSNQILGMKMVKEEINMQTKNNITSLSNSNTYTIIIENAVPGSIPSHLKNWDLE